MANLSEEEKEKYTFLFQQVAEQSEDASGELNTQDFEKLLLICGHVFPKSITASLFVETDTDQDWKISLDEFLNFLSKYAPTGSAHSVAAALRYKFNERDANNDGYLSMDELKVVMRDLEIDLDESWLDEVVKEFDKDGDGRLNFEEFVTMYVKTNILEPDSDADEEEQKENERAVSDVTSILVSADQMRKICDERNLLEDGMIMAEDLRWVLNEAKVSLTSAQMESCLNLLDTEGTGTLAFEEFIGMYEDIAGDQCDKEEENGYREEPEPEVQEQEPEVQEQEPEVREEQLEERREPPVERYEEEEVKQVSEPRYEQEDTKQTSDARYGREEAALPSKGKSQDIAKLSAAFEGRRETKKDYGCHDGGAKLECKEVPLKSLIARFENKGK